MLEAIFNSFLLVMTSEMGDKTMLLALILAARFKKPWTILLGIFVATVLNHALASWMGNYVASLIEPATLRWALGLTFIGFAVWILVPDKEDNLDGKGSGGAFVTTLISFFFAEMGDKTQLATVALAARYQDVVAVTLGSTLGMMATNGLAVAFGRRATEAIPMVWIRRASAALFLIFGVMVIAYASP